VNDYVDVGNNSLVGENDFNFTMSAWIKTISTSQQFIYSEGKGTFDNNLIGIEVSTGQKAQFFIRNNAGGVKGTVDLTSSSSINDGLWHHVLGKKDGDNFSLYLDGSYETSEENALGNIPIEHTGIGVLARVAKSVHFNGSIDEVMIFNRSLSETEIQQIYNSTYSRFYPTGEMLFQNLNFGTNNTVNISIPDCQQINGSYLEFKINEGNYSTLNSTCAFDIYNITGNLTDANLTMRFDSGSYQFYSPILAGNITLNDYFIEGDIIPPNITIIYPENTSYGGLISELNFTAEDNVALDSCWYSKDGGATNSSANDCTTNFTGVSSVEE
jgi:hypothetical protein